MYNFKCLIKESLCYYYKYLWMFIVILDFFYKIFFRYLEGVVERVFCYCGNYKY